MSEINQSNEIDLTQNQIQELETEKIKNVINHFNELDIESQIKTLDGDSDLSDTEKQILEKLNNTNDKILFLGELFTYVKKNKKNDDIDKTFNMFSAAFDSTGTFFNQMKSDTKENICYITLYKKIEKANNMEEDEQNILAALLSHGQSLLNGSKATPYGSIFEEAYNEFAKEIESSIDSNDFSIDSPSYKKIEGKYFNLLTLQSRFSFVGKGIVSGSLSKLTDEVEKKTKLVNKDIEKYSVEEAKWVLELLNINYNDYINRTTNDFGSNTLSTLDGKADTNEFQEKLIKQILGDDKGFNNEYIQGYDESTKNVGNYLIKISDYKEIIKNQPVTEWNSNALANYFEYLESKGELNIENLQDPKVFGKEKLVELGKFWNTKPTKPIAKRILEEKGLGEIVEETINFSEFFEQSLEELSKQIPKMNQKQLDKSIKHLENNPDSANNMVNKYPMGACPKNEKESNLLSLSKEIDYNNKIKKLGLDEYTNKEGKTAEDYLKNLLKGKLCIQSAVKGLDNFKDKDGIDIDIDELVKILDTYITIKEDNIVNEVSSFLSEEEIVEAKSITDKEKLKSYIKSISNTLNTAQQIEVASQITKLQNIELSKKATLEETVFAARNSETNEAFKNLLNNEAARNLMLKLLLTNKDKYLNVINDLNIFDFKIDDVRIAMNSDYILNKLLEIEKVHGLNDNQIELVGILTSLSSVNTYSEEIIEEQEEIKTVRIELEEKNKSIKNNSLNKKEEINKNDFNISNEINKGREFKINKNSNNSTLIYNTSGKEKQIIISDNEAILIKNNPKVADTLMTFNETLTKVGLPNLWKYRGQISSAIGSTGGINNNDDSLKSNELQKFLNNILISVGEKAVDLNPNLDQYINEFNEINKVQTSGKHENKKEIGSSNIEEKFMKKYIIGFTNFQTSKFQNDIKQKKS